MLETKIMGAAINGLVSAITSKFVLKDFPRRAEIEAIEDGEFYPLSLYIELTEYLEEKIGAIVLFKLGKSVGKAVVEQSFPPEIKTVDEGITAIHEAHKVFCKPVIGGFYIVKNEPGHIELKYDAPYNCILQEGLLFEVADKYGTKMPKITHEKCKRKGEPACIFHIDY